MLLRLRPLLRQRARLSSASASASASSASASASAAALSAAPPLVAPRALGSGLGLPASRAPLYRESPLSAFAQRYRPLLSALGVFSRRARVGQASDDLWRSLEEQATQDCWFSPPARGGLGLRREWITEHALLALHAWILHNRLKVDFEVADGGGEFKGRVMMEQLFQRLWDDTTLRVRNAGIVELSVNRQVENVQRSTFQDFGGYDAALADGAAAAAAASAAAAAAGGGAGAGVEEEDDGLELAAALWRGVFREAEDADTEAVLRLADYVKREVVSVLLQPREDLYRGWVVWGPCLGETAEERLARQRRMLEGEWRDALDPAGRLFFYHTSTHERRWDPPDEGLYARRRVALVRYLAENPACAARIGAGDGAAAAARLEAGAASAGAAPGAAAAAALFRRGDEARKSAQA